MIDMQTPSKIHRTLEMAKVECYLDERESTNHQAMEVSNDKMYQHLVRFKVNYEGDVLNQ